MRKKVYAYKVYGVISHRNVGRRTVYTVGIVDFVIFQQKKEPLFKSETHLHELFTKISADTCSYFKH